MNNPDTLLDGLFDYAGMHPPASLPFEKALEKTAAFRRTLERPDIVGGDFVLACEQLPRLTHEMIKWHGFSARRAFRACVLGPTLTSEAAAVMKQVEGLLRVGETADGKKAPLRVVSYELKLSRQEPWEKAAEDVARICERLKQSGVRVFIEPEWSAEDRAEEFAGYFRWFDSLRDAVRKGLLGLKIRGSGPTAVDAQSLSVLLPEVNARRLPLKATAGLHHPLVEPQRYGNSLGFLSLCVALRLQKVLGAQKFGRAELMACLSSESPDDFRIEGGISWKDFSINGRQLAAAMRDVPFSIGSCSLDEPDADIARLFGPRAGKPVKTQAR